MDNIDGIVTGINIRGNRVMYEFSYFLNGDRKNIWLEDYEIKVNKSEKNILKIGFVK